MWRSQGTTTKYHWGWKKQNGLTFPPHFINFSQFLPCDFPGIVYVRAILLKSAPKWFFNPSWHAFIISPGMTSFSLLISDLMEEEKYEAGLIKIKHKLKMLLNGGSLQKNHLFSLDSGAHKSK
jgi:hypothetical protein